jgi:Caspase domain
MATEPPPDVRWQALLVGVASNAYSDDPGFAQSLNSQAELARALERNMPGLHDDDLIVLPEPRYAHEVTEEIARLNEAHDKDGEAGLSRPGLLFYYCGHGMDAGGRLYLSMTETIDNEVNRRRTGLAVGDVLETIRATAFKRPRVALILDCCFAGLACEESAARRAHLLMAVGPDVLATHDPSSTGPTHFTGALVELMREGDPEAGPWIDLETAYRRLKPRLVARYGEDRRPYQRPVNGSGAIVLGRNVAYSGSD